MDSDTQHDWAIALKKQKHHTTRQGQASFVIQQKELKDAFSYHKEKLLTACAVKDKNTIDTEIKKLISLRAKQTVLDMQDIKTLYGELSTDVLDSYMHHYTKDCARLIHGVNLLLA